MAIYLIISCCTCKVLFGYCLSRSWSVGGVTITIIITIIIIVIIIIIIVIIIIIIIIVITI